MKRKWTLKILQRLMSVEKFAQKVAIICLAVCPIIAIWGGCVYNGTHTEKVIIIGVSLAALGVVSVIATIIQALTALVDWIDWNLKRRSEGLPWSWLR